jgi:hypothetical protein
MTKVHAIGNDHIVADSSQQENGQLAYFGALAWVN